MLCNQSYTVHSDFGGNPLSNVFAAPHSVGCGCCSISSPTTRRRTIPGCSNIPSIYVHGTEDQLEREPQNYTRVATPAGPVVLAYGRDPYFAGWPDTLQLNYAESGLQEAMAVGVGEHRGDVRRRPLRHGDADPARGFRENLGFAARLILAGAIERARARNPGFLFMAEVYWDLEWTLQQQGFDYTYDKRLYDRLREGHARPVRDHFRADMDFQRKSARFLENHDEPRAAATFPPGTHQAAAVLTYLCPGLRFFHQGQTEGFTKKIPVHLSRDRPNRRIRT